MKQILGILLIAGLLNAVPSCPAYPYHDFVWESNYQSPVRPPDTLIDQCSNTGVDPAICNTTNLTAAEKRQLVLDGLTSESLYPDFGTAASWNGNISFTKYAPDGAQTYNSTNIRGAWNKIVAIEPSVYSENGTLFVNTSNQLISRHGFSFVVKQETFPSDCSTQYNVCGYGYSVVDTFGVPVSSSTLTINTEYLIHHYQLITHCFSNGISEWCFTTCDYVSSEDRHDSLTITDKVQDAYVDSNSSDFAFIDSISNRLADGWLVFNSSDEFNKATFSVGNSTITFRQSSYKLSSNFSPYNAITPKSNLSPNDFEFYGLAIISREANYSNSSRYEKIHFLAPVEYLNCTFDFYGHFTHEHQDNVCYFDNQTPVLNLTLNNQTNTTILLNLRFYDNQTGNSYPGKQIKITIGNQTLYAITDENGSAQVTLNYSQNSPFVIAEFVTDLQTKSAKAVLAIPVQFPLTLNYLTYLVALILVLFLLYKFSMKVMGFENN